MKVRFYVKEEAPAAPETPAAVEAEKADEPNPNEWAEITTPSGDSFSDSVARIKRERAAEWAEIEAQYTAWKAEGEKSGKDKDKAKNKDKDELAKADTWSSAKTDDKAKAKK
jgi:hypothetical protein